MRASGRLPGRHLSPAWPGVRRELPAAVAAPAAPAPAGPTNHHIHILAGLARPAGPQQRAPDVGDLRVRPPEHWRGQAGRRGRVGAELGGWGVSRGGGVSLAVPVYGNNQLCTVQNRCNCSFTIEFSCLYELIVRFYLKTSSNAKESPKNTSRG